MTTSPIGRKKSQHWTNKTTVDYKFKTKMGSLFPTLMSQAGTDVQTQAHCAFSSCLYAFICNLNILVLTALFGLIHLLTVLGGF